MSEHVGVQVADMNRIHIWAVSDENHYRIVVTPDQARKIQHEINLAFEILARNKPENPVQDKTTEEVVNERLSEVERQQIGLSLVHNHLVKRINEQENFTPRLEERIEALDNHFKNMPTLTTFSAHMKLEKRIEALEKKKPGTKQTYDTDCLRRINTQAETLCEHRKRIEEQNKRIEALEQGHKLAMELISKLNLRFDTLKNALIRE